MASTVANYVSQRKPSIVVRGVGAAMCLYIMTTCCDQERDVFDRGVHSQPGLRVWLGILTITVPLVRYCRRYVVRPTPIFAIGVVQRLVTWLNTGCVISIHRPPSFCQTMPCSHFMLILRYVHFVDNEDTTTDVYAHGKCRRCWTMFANVFESRTHRDAS